MKLHNILLQPRAYKGGFTKESGDRRDRRDNKGKEDRETRQGTGENKTN